MALRLFLSRCFTASKYLGQGAHSVPLKAKRPEQRETLIQNQASRIPVDSVILYDLFRRVILGILLLIALPMVAHALSAPSLPTTSFRAYGSDGECGDIDNYFADFGSALAALVAYTDSCPYATDINEDSCLRIEPSLGGASSSCRYVRNKTSGDHVGGWVTGSFSCPNPGTRYKAASGYCEASDSWQAGKNNRSDCNPNDVGNPCNAGTGHKHQLESDYQAAGPGRLRFLRYYSSLQVGVSPLGSNWRHNYAGRVLKDPAGNFVRVERPNGQTLIFRPNGTGGWTTDSDVSDQLQEGAQWRYTTADKEIEVYDASGRLQSISDRNGLTQTLSYSDATTPKAIASYPGLLLQVADQFGRKIQLNYDTYARIAVLVDPNGAETLYGYDNDGRLASVTYSDGNKKTYLYGETANVSATPNAGVNYTHALTGIIDENGVRYASWTYDAAGRAISSEHAGSAEKVTLDYNADGSTKVSEYQNDPKTSSTSRVYSFQTILGVVKNTSISQANPNGSTSYSSSTYDANGNIASRTDFNNHKTCYAYDLSRNLETQRIEGLPATANCAALLSTGSTLPAPARQITTSWHATYRLPLAIAEPLKLTTYTYYDPSGLLRTRSEQATSDADGRAGLSPTLQGSARTWTMTYNDLGQVLTVDGPRTDVADTTSYTYTTDGHSDLATITNSLGQVTRLADYDANGRARTITAANGVVTSLDYTPRGWLKSLTQTYGTTVETTQYTYTPSGQLKTVTPPDGSLLTYGYDDAQRLTSITDNLGNKVTYLLDNAGNRKNETATDANGGLRRTITRVYDALNRLQTVTGAAQ